MKKNGSLLDLRRDLAEQWDFNANYPLTPDKISLMSRQKVGWICSQGHTWTNDPQHRARAKSAECPFCSGRRVIPGQTDLFTLCPELKSQWNYARNHNIDPRTLHRASNKKVWWICEKGHEWSAVICHRAHTKNPTGCPYCENMKVKIGENDLHSQRPDISSDWDYAANAPLLPTQVTVGSGVRVHWKCKKGHKWKTAIAHRTTPNKPTGCPFCNGKKPISGQTDLATLRPDLMKQWDFSLNQGLDPSILGVHSAKEAYWKCSMGHSWRAYINSRTRKNGVNCPYCSGRYPIPGETDMETLFPDIAKQWHREKNGMQTPSSVSAMSNKKVAWICSKGHNWNATIASRTHQGNGCPICNGRKPEIGNNDLCTLRPDLVLDWDPIGNGDRQPQEFSCNSSYIAVWCCHKCGAKWKKAILSRNYGNKCPVCKRQQH